MCKGSNLLLRVFLFISIIFSCYVHAEDVIESAQKKFHKIPVTNFVVKIEKVYDYNLALLVKKKMPGEYLEQWRGKTPKIFSFNKLQRLNKAFHHLSLTIIYKCKLS